MTGLELMPFRHLLDEVVERAKPHLRQIYPTILPAALLAGVLATLYQRAAVELSIAVDMALLPTVLLLLLAFSTVLFLALSALTVASIDVILGREVDMKRAWFFAFRPKVAVTMAIVLALLFGLLVGPFFFSATVMTFFGLIGTALALLLLLPFFVLALVLLAFVMPVMVAEERYFLSALGRSASLAWVNRTGKLRDSGFLQALVLLVVGWLVVNALGILVQGPAALVQNYFLFRATTDGAVGNGSMLAPLWFDLPAQAASVAMAVAAWAYWTFGFGLLYLEIRRRREAYDLEQAIDALVESAPRGGGATARPPTDPRVDAG